MFVFGLAGCERASASRCILICPMLLLGKISPKSPEIAIPMPLIESIRIVHPRLRQYGMLGIQVRDGKREQN